MYILMMIFFGGGTSSAYSWVYEPEVSTTKSYFPNIFPPVTVGVQCHVITISNIVVLSFTFIYLKRHFENNICEALQTCDWKHIIQSLSPLKNKPRRLLVTAAAGVTALAAGEAVEYANFKSMMWVYVKEYMETYYRLLYLLFHFLKLLRSTNLEDVNGM